MDIRYRTTFLRTTLVENPFALGDLIDFEDICRMESEYPELFSTDVGNFCTKKESKVTQTKPLQRFMHLGGSLAKKQSDTDIKISTNAAQKTLIRKYSSEPLKSSNKLPSSTKLPYGAKVKSQNPAPTTTYSKTVKISTNQQSKSTKGYKVHQIFPRNFERGDGKHEICSLLSNDSLASWMIEEPKKIDWKCFPYKMTNAHKLEGKFAEKRSKSFSSVKNLSNYTNVKAKAREKTRPISPFKFQTSLVREFLDAKNRSGSAKYARECKSKLTQPQNATTGVKMKSLDKTSGKLHIAHHNKKPLSVINDETEFSEITHSISMIDLHCTEVGVQTSTRELSPEKKLAQIEPEKESKINEEPNLASRSVQTSIGEPTIQTPLISTKEVINVSAQTSFEVPEKISSPVEKDTIAVQTSLSERKHLVKPPEAEGLLKDGVATVAVQTSLVDNTLKSLSLKTSQMQPKSEKKSSEKSKLETYNSHKVVVLQESTSVSSMKSSLLSPPRLNLPSKSSRGLREDDTSISDHSFISEEVSVSFHVDENTDHESKIKLVANKMSAESESCEEPQLPPDKSLKISFDDEKMSLRDGSAKLRILEISQNVDPLTHVSSISSVKQQQGNKLQYSHQEHQDCENLAATQDHLQDVAEELVAKAGIKSSPRNFIESSKFSSTWSSLKNSPRRVHDYMKIYKEVESLNSTMTTCSSSSVTQSDAHISDGELIGHHLKSLGEMSVSQYGLSVGIVNSTGDAFPSKDNSNIV